MSIGVSHPESYTGDAYRAFADLVRAEKANQQQAAVWPGKPDMSTMEKLVKMIASRMRWDQEPHNNKIPVHFLTAYESAEQVHVFIAAAPGSPPVQLDDEKSLFPSDLLITKIRTLVG